MISIRKFFVASVFVMLLTTAARAGKNMPIEIRLRLLNPWSGKPIAKQSFSLFEVKGAIGTEVKKKDVVTETRTQTASDGTAVFVLSEPIPDRLLFNLGSLRSCPHKGEPPIPNGFKPEEIIREGLIVPDSCVPKNWHGKFDWRHVTAKPGEIIIFASGGWSNQW